MSRSGALPLEQFDADTDDLAQLNAVLCDCAPEEIVRWALSLEGQAIATTSFSPNAAVMLHLITRVDPAIPVVWVDTGYNTRDTYLVAETLTQKLGLNIQVYTPQMTSARRDALMGIPTPDDDPGLHREFTRQVKLEPFERALSELQPLLWLTGIRRNETEFRRTLDVVSRDNRGILKVAPIFYFSDAEVERYMDAWELPSCRKYFDPTKVADNRECGLHTGGP